MTLHAPKAADRDELVEKLSHAFDTAHARCKALIERQDDIVRGLGRIQKLLKLGAGDAAATEMTDLLATDLKQSRERVYNHDAALRIAIKALQFEISNSAGEGEAEKVLPQIKMLVPDAFQEVQSDMSVKS